MGGHSTGVLHKGVSSGTSVDRAGGGSLRVTKVNGPSKHGSSTLFPRPRERYHKLFDEVFTSNVC
ncbi:conserved hypothetical protein [Streptomyces sp. SPB78]|nr:conserved hypothetical protein [Streptomyces sp. SPB78]